MKRRIGCLGRDFLRRCVAPQVFKTVEFANVALEDVYYDIDIVEQHPAQAAVAFAVPDFHSGIPEFVDDVIGDRARLHIGIHRADHEIVADCGQLAQVKDFDIVGFLVERQIGYLVSQFIWSF